jgi:mannose-6-phosphate isomerase-like protein (cupin superfamily)
MFKFIGFALLASLGMAAEVDIYPPSEVQGMTEKLSQKGAPFSSQSLKNYGNHYTMLAHREATGSSEVHEKESDVFVITAGSATLVSGGRMVNSHAEKPGELRGTSIAGGQKQAVQQGSIIHIPAGVPHQLIVGRGQPVTYFVVKVIDSK